MELSISVCHSIKEIQQEEYTFFHYEQGGSVFYDWHFLTATEHSPLLPVLSKYYIVVRAHNLLVAVLPVYLQELSIVDPFGILAEKTGLSYSGHDLILVSHVMHCFDSRIPSRKASLELNNKILIHFRRLAVECGACYFGFLNVSDPFFLSHARALGMSASYMVDRWQTPISASMGFETFIEKLPADGRREMRRQLRKFESSRAEIIILSPPFDQRLDKLAELCHQTTARYGTPQFFPAKPLAKFCRECGDLIRLHLIEYKGNIFGGLICFLEKDVIHVWSAGMCYEGIPFSPYALAFASVFRYAHEHNLSRIEAGRLNEKIKMRLGLHPTPLYAVVSERLKKTTEE